MKPGDARRRAPRTCDRSGLAVVETAFVLPLLLLLVLGTWEVGRYLDASQVIASACRDAGRRAASGLETSSQIQQEILTYLSNSNVPTSGANVTIQNLTTNGADPTAANQLDHLRVTISVPAANVRWLSGSYLGQTGNLTASSDWYSMRDIPVSVSAAIPPE